MARQSFRGAGGAGAVILPYDREHAAGEYEVTPISQPLLAGDSRVEGAFAIAAAAVLAVVAILVTGWTFAG